MAKKNAILLTTYQWGEDSLIRQVDLRKQGNGEFVAYIYATEKEAEDLADLHRLREIFGQKGWVTSSDSRNDKPVLRLTGLTNPNQLLELLQNDKYTQSTPAISYVTAESEKPKSFMESVRRNSLRGSGIFYMLGNSLYIINGILRSRAAGKVDVGQIGTGLAFSSGDALLALVGDKNDNKQFKSLLKKLKKHLQTHHIDIPTNSAIAAETIAEKRGTGERIHDFVHEHVNKFKALAEVIGAFTYYKAGVDHKIPEKKLTAVIFGLGFGSSLIIKEKKPDKEKLKHANFLQKAWAFWQEKPLRIAGWSGLSNTVLTTKGALRTRRENPSDPFYKYELATAGSMLIGNNLYALSNKNTGGSITSGELVNDIYGIAAQVINRLPEEKREAAIKTTVDFLGERTEIKDTREEVDQFLRAEIDRTNHNPWFKARFLESTKAKPAVDSPDKWKSHVIQSQSPSTPEAKSLTP